MNYFWIRLSCATLLVQYIYGMNKYILQLPLYCVFDFYSAAELSVVVITVPSKTTRHETMILCTDYD